MNFNSYIVKNVEIAQTVPLSCLPFAKPLSNKGFGLFRRHAKRAFTLAETLITLTIIGVIAAMTIPTLVSKYQNIPMSLDLKKLILLFLMPWLLPCVMMRCGSIIAGEALIGMIVDQRL